MEFKRFLLPFKQTNRGGGGGGVPEPGRRTAPSWVRPPRFSSFLHEVRFVAALKNDGGSLLGLWLTSSPRWRHRGRIATDRRVLAAHPFSPSCVTVLGVGGSGSSGFAHRQGAQDDELQTATAGGRVHRRDRPVLPRGQRAVLGPLPQFPDG